MVPIEGVINMKKYNKNCIIKNILSNQKGMALLTTLIFVFILVTFAVALLTMTSNDNKLSALQEDSTKAFFTADAGIDKALWYLNTPKDQGGKDKFLWRPGYSDSYPEPFIEGTSLEYYEITIEDIGNSLGEVDDTDIIQITSIGVVKNSDGTVAGKRTVVVTAEIGISQFSAVSYDNAIFTDDNMTLNGGISIDGSIHSNGDLTNNGILDLINGSATAVGDIINMEEYGGTNEGIIIQDFPHIDFQHFRELVIDPANPDDTNENENGKYYGKDTAVVFNVDTPLVGIHFIDGDVKIQANLTFYEATIFATGTIEVIGSGDVDLHNDISPLALIAKGDITIGGSVHGAGIIQSEATITINGNVNIDPGALYAIDGVLNGGGGTINVVYDTSLAGKPITGTGVEIYVKASWQEAY